MICVPCNCCTEGRSLSEFDSIQNAVAAPFNSLKHSEMTAVKSVRSAAEVMESDPAASSASQSTCLFLQYKCPSPFSDFTLPWLSFAEALTQKYLLWLENIMFQVKYLL